MGCRRATAPHASHSVRRVIRSTLQPMSRTRSFIACLFWLLCLSISANASTLASEAVQPTQLALPTQIQARQSDHTPGWLNLQTLLASPHKNSYLWGTLAFLGVLSVGAGLSIQHRRTTQRLGIFQAQAPKSESVTPKIPTHALELPPHIVALSLDLDSTTPALNTLAQAPHREHQK